MPVIRAETLVACVSRAPRSRISRVVALSRSAETMAFLALRPSDFEVPGRKDGVGSDRRLRGKAPVPADWVCAVGAKTFGACGVLERVGLAVATRPLK